MENSSNSSASMRGSPVEARRRVDVMSLLNSDAEATTKFTAANAPIAVQQREGSEPTDSAVDMDMEPGSPDSDESDEADNVHGNGRRNGSTPARLRKKQWTHEHVRKLQQLYKQDQRWEVIAEKLGRSAVACKLKHNKELRRKAPIVMPLPREVMHAPHGPHGPQQLVNDALGALSSVQQQLHDTRSTMMSRIHDSVEEAFRAYAHQQEEASRASPNAARRVDAAALIDRLQQQLQWEVSAAAAREQQTLGDAWAAVAQLQSQTAPSPRPIPAGVPMSHRY